MTGRRRRECAPEWDPTPCSGCAGTQSSGHAEGVRSLRRGAHRGRRGGGERAFRERLDEGSDGLVVVVRPAKHPQHLGQVPHSELALPRRHDTLQLLHQRRLCAQLRAPAVALQALYRALEFTRHHACRKREVAALTRTHNARSGPADPKIADFWGLGGSRQRRSTHAQQAVVRVARQAEGVAEGRDCGGGCAGDLRQDLADQRRLEGDVVVPEQRHRAQRVGRLLQREVRGRRAHRLRQPPEDAGGLRLELAEDAGLQQDRLQERRTGQRCAAPLTALLSRAVANCRAGA